MENNIKIKDNNDHNLFADALKIAIKDIEQDADFSLSPQPTDDLDEGELAKFDNSDEKAFDALENADLLKNINTTPNINNAP